MKNTNIVVSKGVNYFLIHLSVFLYIASAVAFEMTENTSFISSIAIYWVFAVGVIFIMQNKKLIINEYVLFVLFFVLYVFLLTISQGSPASTGLTVAYKTLTCTVLCVFWFSCSYEDLTKMSMIAYIVGAVILSFRIVAEYGGIREIIEFASMEGEHRIGGLLGNENGIGLFLANGILCSLFFLVKSTKKCVKIISVCVVLGLSCMLLFTGSRNSLVFVVIGCLFIVYFNYRKSRLRKRFSVLLIAVTSVVLLYWAITTLPMFSTINERLSLLFDGFFRGNTSYETDQTRKMMISEGLNAFYQKPLFGNGTAHSYRLFGTYSHNNFVELLMNYGIIGFSLFYLSYAIIIVKLFRLALREDIYAVYFLSYILFQTVLGIGWIYYYERTSQLITALAFGYLVAKERERRISNEN